jgi:serine/threonine-protein phosphatase 2A regulatory subunit B''
MLFNRIVEIKGTNMVKVGNEYKLTRSVLQKIWDDLDYQRMPVKKRLFSLIAKAGANHITPEDFKPMFSYLLEKHPGLEFLQQTPEFQERYADTVVMRIFYTLDANDDGKIYYRDFKNSNLFEVFF